MYVRGLFEDGLEFRPQFKVVLVCNDEPVVPSEDLAFWKRARVLPHESVFDENCPKYQEEQFNAKRFPIDRRFWEKIPGLVQPFMWKLLRKYEETKGGIINVEPQKVLAATSRYRRANDKFKSFAEDIMVYKKGSYVTVSDAYSRYKEWLRDGSPGMKYPDKNHFKEQLSRYLCNDPNGKGWENFEMRDTDEPVNEEDKDTNGLGRFIEECTEESTSNIYLKEMYEAYCKWASKNGIGIGEENAFKSKFEIVENMVIRRTLKNRGEDAMNVAEKTAEISNSSVPPSSCSSFSINCLSSGSFTATDVASSSSTSCTGISSIFGIPEPPLICIGDHILREKIKKDSDILDETVAENESVTEDENESSDEEDN